RAFSNVACNCARAACRAARSASNGPLLELVELVAALDLAAYMFMGTERNAAPLQPGRYCEGPSLDGQGSFSFRAGFEPLGEEPVLGPARPDSGAQVEQMNEPPVTNALA